MVLIEQSWRCVIVWAAELGRLIGCGDPSTNMTQCALRVAHDDDKIVSGIEVVGCRGLRFDELNFSL